MADQTGGVLPGVTVEVAAPGLADRSRVAVTDGEGRYVVDGLPAGDYSVSFSLPGFETAQRDGVSATGPDGAALDVVLQFASFSDEVTVVGSKLDTGRQEFGTSVAYLGRERLESDAIFTVEDAFNRTANAFTGTAQFGAYSASLGVTHIVDDVESLCERLSILADRRIVAEGTPAALTAPLEGRLWSRVVPRGEPMPGGALHVSATPAGSLVVVEAPTSPGEAWTPQAPRLEDYHAAIARAGTQDEETAA